MTAAHYSSRADRIAPFHLSDRVGLSFPALSPARSPDVDIDSLTWMVQRGAGRHGRSDGSHHDFSLIGVLMGHIWAPQIKLGWEGGRTAAQARAV